MLIPALNLVSAALPIASFAVVRRAYADLPERVPIHFGITGEPDAWGPRMTIWLLPIIGVALFLTFVVIGLLAHRPSELLMLAAEQAACQALFLHLARAQLRVALGQASRFGNELWGYVAASLLLPLALYFFQ